MTIAIFIRHGNIDLRDRVPGRLPDIHLSAHGVEQASRVADYLGKKALSAILSSPLDRTFETAQLLAQRTGIAIEKRENLIEIDFGEWTGKTFDELESDYRWKQFHVFRNGCPVPGGELMVHVQIRMLRELESIYERFPNGIVALVSHNDPIKSVIAHCLGIPLDMFLRIQIDTGSMSVIELKSDRMVVHAVNLFPERMQV